MKKKRAMSRSPSRNSLMSLGASPNDLTRACSPARSSTHTATCPIAGAVGVRLGASPVQGQLKLEIVLGIAQIDERKLGEIQAARRLEAERVAVETHGPVQVEDADHGVDHFRHSNLPTTRKRGTLCTDRKTNLARVARGAATGRPTPIGTLRALALGSILPVRASDPQRSLRQIAKIPLGATQLQGATRCQAEG